MEFDYASAFSHFQQNLEKYGCFLVTGSENPNIMTIGWAFTGIMWKREVMVVPVRYSRYTHDVLSELEEFTVCMCKDPSRMKKELAFTGTKSGRDINKANELGLTLSPSKTVSVPHIADTDIVYECKVLYVVDLPAGKLDKAVDERFYAAGDYEGDYHTLYFGEITACYEK